MDCSTSRPGSRSLPLALAAALALVVAVAAPRSAGAQVRQPDGTTVPVGDSLGTYLSARGETIDVITEASTTPERFVPGCTIRFTVVARDTSYMNSFGWYNVHAGRAPTDSELNELVSTSAPEGFTATLDVRTDTRYAGGEIGFYLRTPPGYVYYSERAYQPDAAMTGGFVHVLIYDSRVTRNAFYFAWEDLFGGGDNDFQDLLMIVDNLVCAGGGAPCDTGERGACAAGIRQCHSGALTCVRLSGPQAERCDGIDNDCNGTTDDGNGLCPAGQVCERGNCVPQCVEGSCFAGEVCDARGFCVEAACATMTCPEGQRCTGGRCVGACDGVTCPHGQACRAGRCVDPCAGLACDAEQVCVAGVCEARCPCRACPTGSTCATSGQCISSGCEAMTCGAGQYCEGGTCRDACAGAVCPAGQACSMGACRDVPAGADAGVGMDGGAGLDGGARTDAGRGADGARGPDGGTNVSSGGCGCRAAGGSGSGARGGALALGALALAAAVRRARSRRRRVQRAAGHPQG